MTKSTLPILALTLSLTVAGATAQANHTLVGVTQFTASLAESRHTPCVGLSGCPTGLPLMPGAFAAGGTAYDGTNDTVWATTGQVIASFGTGCAPACPPSPCPKSSSAANASGLDVVESLDQLWVVDDAGFLTRATLSCPPVVIGSCNLGLPTGVIPTGVAVDDGRGIVFITTVSAIGSQLHVTQMSSPCSSTFSITPLISCTSSAVPASGIAVDWGNEIVYWTDGPSTYSFPYNYNSSGPSIAFGSQSCCNFVVSPNDPYTDLTLKPRVGSPAGNPCANGSCPTCINWHSLRNAPILGNTIELGLDDAPEASLAWCLVSFGPCTTGMPTISPLCGPLLVSGVGPTLGVNVTTGVAGCNGTTTFALPLPAVPGFAGIPLSSQCVMLCGGGTGTALSNCQSWVLLGS